MIVPFKVGVTPERLRAAGEKAGMDDAKLNKFATDGQLVLDLSTAEDGTLVGGHVVDVVASVKEQPSKPAGPITALDVIAAYIATRDIIEAKQKALNNELEALKEVQQNRERYLTKHLDSLGANNLGKAGVGTCFFKMATSVKVADGKALKDWIGEDYANRSHFLANSASKDAVKQQLEEGKPVPPGIDYTQVRTIAIQRR